jgi:hypothetical protein
MITYRDGTEARVGDKVSLSHGNDTGVVSEAIESAEKKYQWNIEETGLMIESKAYGLTFYQIRSGVLDEDIIFLSRSSV